MYSYERWFSAEDSDGGAINTVCVGAELQHVFYTRLLDYVPLRNYRCQFLCVSAASVHLQLLSVVVNTCDCGRLTAVSPLIT